MKTSLLVVGLAATLLVSPAHASDGASDWAYAIAHELMSPYCPGRTLAECPSPQASDLRFWILQQSAAGVNEDEVRAMLEERFGDVLLAAPRAEGWGLSAYVVPIVFFVLGGPVVVTVIRRMTARKDAGAAEDVQRQRGIDPDLERQLENELAEF